MKSLLRTLLVIALVALLAGCALPSPNAVAPTPATTPEISQPAVIVADGVVVPARAVDVSFAVSGVVSEVLAEEGDTVATGAPLARLDDADLHLLVEARKAELAQAQAAYERIVAGASEQQIAAQQAQLRSVQAQLERARTGNVGPSDIAGAQADLRAAQARLAALSEPTPANRSAAEFGVTQARSTLDSVRANASAAKTNAELTMRQAANDLTKAQAIYATAKANWDYVRETGQDPTSPNRIDPATGKSVKNKLNDVQKRQYAETFVQAEATLRSAEKAVTQAQVSYDAARQDEAIQVQQAEAALANAEQQLAALKNPSSADRTQAEAAVAQARATLQSLERGGTAADVAAAQGAVELAEANLAQLTAPPRPAELAEGKARVEAASIALQQAERELARATLAAPFAATVAERSVEAGQRVNGMNPANFVLADQSAWRIETRTLSERDVVRVQLGAPVRITFDALPELILTGAVTTIRPRGADQFGDITYTVSITPDEWDERLRWNMSASVTIEPVVR
jgi:HlyD family secretion protein